MNIAHDIVNAVMNNDAVAVQGFIDAHQIQTHNCLALRTAVYCNNISMTQMVVAHSDVFAWDANAVHLSIENNSKDIFDILFPYVCAKNDAVRNFEFLLQAIAIDHAYFVEQLVSHADLPHQDITGIFLRLNQNPQQRIVQSLMDNMITSQRFFLAEHFTLAGDARRLEVIVNHLNLSEVQDLHALVSSFRTEGVSLSEKGQHCFDIIDQHRQKCVLLNTVSGRGTHKPHKI